MNLFRQFKKSSVTHQAYVVACLLGIVGLSLIWKSFPIRSDYGYVVFDISMALFTFGFVVWSLPWFRITWNHRVGRIAILVLNVVVLLLSTALSRNIVASAIGLPPQDFDLSVGFIALTMYPVAWCFVVAAPIGLLAVIFQCGAFLQSHLQRSPNGNATRLFGHALGATGLFISAAGVIEGYSTLQARAYPAVRWVAFFADYQVAPAYPGVGAQERIRLHENGVISFPVIENGMLLIKTRKFDS